MEIYTLRAFRSYNYRLYFAGQSVSLIGTWMQKTAVSWLVYSLTHSSFMLGVSMCASLLPSFIFSFAGGVTADRYNRYKVLLLTQALSMLQALLLAVLVAGGQYHVWAIIALSSLLGVINAFDVPARQALVYDIVEVGDLPNALALNSSMVHLSRLVGCALAGLLIEQVGHAACFGINTVSFLVVILSLKLMRLPQGLHKAKIHTKTGIAGALAYVRDSSLIASLLAILALTNLLALPFTVLLPVYTRDVFHGTAATFGCIDSILGAGAIFSAIFLAALKPCTDLRKVLLINTLVFGTGLILLALTSSYPLALIAVAICGFAMMSVTTAINTMIQTVVSPAMRGRVISLYAMSFFGILPVGYLLACALCRYIGLQNTVLLEGGAALLIGLLQMHLIKMDSNGKQAVPVYTLVQPE